MNEFLDEHYQSPIIGQRLILRNVIVVLGLLPNDRNKALLPG